MKTRTPPVPKALRRICLEARHVLRSTHPGPKGILLGVSGGLDSTVLAHALACLAPRENVTLHAIHINHGISDAAPLMEQSARALCDELTIPLEVVSVNVPTDSGLGLEGAARDARHAALETQRTRLGVPWIALAHHATDVAETFLHRLLQGSGRGQAAMLPVEGAILRPLWACTRTQLEDAAGQLQLRYQQDPMNADPSVFRVFLRRSIWPMLETRLGRVDAPLARAAQAAQEDHHALETLARQYWSPQTGMERKALQGLPMAVCTRALRQMVEDCAGGPVRTGNLAVRKAVAAARQTGGPKRRFKAGPVWICVTEHQVMTTLQKQAKDHPRHLP